MVVSRRFFLGSASAAALFAGYRPAKAWIHGSASAQKIGQFVINPGRDTLGFINYAHGFNPRSTQANFPSLLTADGYPSTGASLTAAITGPFNLDGTYYGHYQVWWTGSGNLSFTGVPAIVYSGGTCAGLGGASGTVQSNFGIGGGSPQPNLGGSGPIEFAFGALVSAVSGGGGSLVTITTNTVRFGSGFATGTQIKLGVGCSANLSSGPNSDGSWTITNVSATQFTLNNSTGVVSPTITGTGGAGTQTEAVMQLVNSSAQFGNGVTYTGFSGLFMVKSAWAAAAQAGQYASPDYVTAIKALNPRFIRFMDYQAVQNDRSSSYTYITQPSNLCWNTVHFVPDYYVGQATNGGASGSATDLYTCANPTASPASGAYVDGEVVDCFIDATNAGNKPYLGITGRTGSAPILDGQTTNSGACLVACFCTGSVPAAGKVVTINFTGGGLGAPYSPTYTVLAGDTTFATLWGHIATQLRSDATLIAANILPPFNGGVSGSVISFQYNPNVGGLGASPLTVTASDNGPSGTYTFGTQKVSNMTASGYYLFTYSALLGAWLNSGSIGNTQTNLGINCGPPLEFYADLCNRANVGAWIQIGQMWNATRVFNTVQKLAQLGVKELVVEFSNETWNTFAAEWAISTALGNALGLNATNGNLNKAEDSLTGLRTAQISQQAASAWTGAGRSRSQLHIQLSIQFNDMRSTGTSSSTVNRFNGALLNPSGNTVLTNNGGLGATAWSTNCSSSPNRPIDLSDSCGGAPYFSGQQLNFAISASSGQVLRTTDYTGTSITISAYNSLVLAAYNYVYGNPTQQAAALDFLYNENSGTPNGDLYNGTLNGTFNHDSQLASWDIASADATAADTFGIGIQIATYDSSRASAGLGQLGYANYEGFLQQAPIFGSDVTALASSLTTLGYTNGYASGLPGAAAGPSGASDTATNAANCIAVLLYGTTSGINYTLTGSPNSGLVGFKNDNRFFLLTTKYFNLIKAGGQWSGSTSINRQSNPGTYDFDGPNVWALYPGNVNTTPFQSWNAIQAIDN